MGYIEPSSEYLFMERKLLKTFLCNLPLFQVFTFTVFIMVSASEIFLGIQPIRKILKSNNLLFYICNPSEIVLKVAVMLHVIFFYVYASSKSI